MGQALQNEEKARQRHREMQTPQVRATEITAENGYTKANGFGKDKEGRLTYVKPKK
jgi:hypothetical protein